MKKINGLSQEDANLFWEFIDSKRNDSYFDEAFENLTTNDDISGEDIMHEIFERFGEEETEDNQTYINSLQYERTYFYRLKIGEKVFTTSQVGENWTEEYKMEYYFEEELEEVNNDNFKEKLIYIKEFVESGYCDRLIIEHNLYNNPDDAINRYLKSYLPNSYKDLEKIEEQIMNRIGYYV